MKKAIEDTKVKFESQMKSEGLDVCFETTLATCCFMLNSLTVINEACPYTAVLGRQPNLLPPVEGGDLAQRDDEHLTPGTRLRHQARCREVALSAVSEGLARQRLDLVNKVRAQQPLDAYGYKPEDKVDYFTPQQSKDEPDFWRGPATDRLVSF